MSVSLMLLHTSVVEVDWKVCLLCTALIKVCHVPSTMSPCRVARMPCIRLQMVEIWT